MKHRSTSRELKELLEHQAWVRGLALRLVGDPELAEDLAQETCVVALQQEPGGIQTMRAWLATVLRNLVRERARSEGARAWRETQSARPEALASTYEVFERVTAHRLVVEALTELPAPYRDVLLLRYFDGLTPTEIGSRLGMPLSSVKTRLARGLSRLREDLDRQAGGDGKAWLQGLAPLLAALPEASPATVAPAMSMLKLSAIVLCAVSWTWFIWPIGEEARAVQGEVSSPNAPFVRKDPLPERAQDRTGEGQQRAEGSPSLDSTQGGDALEQLQAPADYPLAGLVVDEQGRPIAGLVLSFEAMRPTSKGMAIAVSAADGAFAFPAARGLGTVRALGEGYVTLLAGEARAGEADQNLRVVVAKGSRLAGRVVDEQGAPVVDAEVAVLAPQRGWLDILPRDENQSLDLRFVLSDEVGRFDLGVAIDLPGAVLQVCAEGFQELSMERPPGQTSELRLNLQRPAQSAADISGRVESPQGAPLAGCRVGFQGRVTRTNAAGEFRFANQREADSTAARGVLSAWMDGYGPALAAAPLSSEPVRLQLEPRPLEIQGRALDALGKPRSGLYVFLQEPTVFSFEGEFSGVMNRGQGSTGTLRSRAMRYEVLEDLAAGHAGKGLRWTKSKTDAEGRFTIEGLARQEYALVIFDPVSMARMETQPIAAGTSEVDVTFEPFGLPAGVAGRLVDPRGQPASGVNVSAWCPAHRVSLSDKQSLTNMHSHAAVPSNKAGEFFLGELALEHLELRLTGEGWVSQQVSCAASGIPAQIQMERALPILFELSDVNFADHFGVLDASGQGLPLIDRSPGRERLIGRAALIAGRSEMYRVSEAAREWVLFKAGVEVQRAPFQFEPEGWTRLAH